MHKLRSLFRQSKRASSLQTTVGYSCQPDVPTSDVFRKEENLEETRKDSLYLARH